MFFIFHFLYLEKLVIDGKTNAGLILERKDLRAFPLPSSKMLF